MDRPKAHDIFINYIDEEDLENDYRAVMAQRYERDEETYFESSGYNEDYSCLRDGTFDGRSSFKYRDGNPTIDKLSTTLNISNKELGWLYSTWGKWNQWYKSFAIPKRTEGFRLISAPQGLLKYVQHSINEEILSNLKYSDCCHGFRKGFSIVSNAEPHAYSEIVIKIDIKDFFQTISAKRVYGIFIKVGYDKDCARFLTRLCTLNGSLPQGAPTSPSLANRVCASMDRRIFGLVRKFNFNYTRYADDITVSGARDIVKLLPLIRFIIYDEGFRVNEKKLKICRRNMRQQVTGLTVNDGVKIPRNIKRMIRAMIYYSAIGKKPHFEHSEISEDVFNGYVSYLRYIDRPYYEKSIMTSVGINDKTIF